MSPPPVLSVYARVVTTDNFLSSVHSLTVWLPCKYVGDHGCSVRGAWMRPTNVYIILWLKSRCLWKSTGMLMPAQGWEGAVPLPDDQGHGQASECGDIQVRQDAFGIRRVLMVLGPMHGMWNALPFPGTQHEQPVSARKFLGRPVLGNAVKPSSQTPGV